MLPSALISKTDKSRAILTEVGKKKPYFLSSVPQNRAQDTAPKIQNSKEDRLKKTEGDRLPQTQWILKYLMMFL